MGRAPGLGRRRTTTTVTTITRRRRRRADDHDDESGWHDHHDTSGHDDHHGADHEPWSRSRRCRASSATVVNYGPYSIPAAPLPQPDGKHGHAHTGNMFQCSRAEAVLQLLHHGHAGPADVPGRAHRRLEHRRPAPPHGALQPMSWGRPDATCGGQFLGFLGERFFASGDERTPMPTAGYGYYVSWLDNWTMIYELANEKTTPQNVIIEMTYDWVPGTTLGHEEARPGVVRHRPVRPVGVQRAGRPNTRNWTWTVNRPGKIVASVATSTTAASTSPSGT